MYLIKNIRVYGYANNVEVTKGIQVFGLEKGGVVCNLGGIDVSVDFEDSVDFDFFSTNLGEFWKRLERVSDVKIADDGRTIHMDIKNDEDDVQTCDGFIVFIKVPIMEKTELTESCSKFKVSMSEDSWHASLINQMVAVLKEGDWIETSGKKICVENESLIVRNM